MRGKNPCDLSYYKYRSCRYLLCKFTGPQFGAFSNWYISLWSDFCYKATEGWKCSASEESKEEFLGAHTYQIERIMANSLFAAEIR